MATGPSVRYEMLYTCPEYQNDCIEYITSLPRRKYSLFVSDVMDRMGYSFVMIKCRQQTSQDSDNIDNIKLHGPVVVTTGGKGEGTALLYESDHDHMTVLNDIICSDDPRLIHQEHFTVFKTENQETSPGYTRLKLLKFEGVQFKNIIRQSMFESDSGSYYLSSDFFIGNLKQISQRTYNEFGLTQERISGPSTPASNQFNSVDLVVCFRCICKDYLEQWIARPRHYGWPSSDSIHNISQLDGHVVPVGIKGSENMYKEWRICYSYAELHLMRNLNETQLKLYIILKKLAKSALKPVCDDMTSYIMKNVVLWICELNGESKFKPDLLMDRLFDCLIYLRACIIRENLPSYMISARNLLERRVDAQQREDITNLLSILLKEGGSMVLRCSKIRDGMLLMYTCPFEYTEYGEKRDKIETLMLMIRLIDAQTYEIEMSKLELNQLLAMNEECTDIMMHIAHLLQFDIQALILLGYNDDEMNDIFNRQICQLLS